MTYDTNSTLVTNTAPYDTHIPFTVHLRVVPYGGGGRRLAMIRSLQMTAKFIEDDLLGAGWNIATPVAFKPQSGNTSATITLQGFFSRDEIGTETTDVPNQTTTTDVSVISAGTVPGERTALISGNKGGSLSWGQHTKPFLDVLANYLKTQLETDSAVIGGAATVDSMTIMGVKFGRRARSFPPPL